MSQTSKPVGRNAPCSCGSGKKYKQCCLDKDQLAAREAQAEAANQNTQTDAKGDEASDKKVDPSPGKSAVPRSQSGKGRNQPWKRAAGNTHPTQRTMPRKAGNK